MRLMTLCFFCVLFITTGCKKKVTISGEIINYFDGSPVEGLVAEVSGSIKKSIRSKMTSFGPMTSDSQGHFSGNFTFNKSNNYSYRLYQMNLFLVDTAAEIQKAYVDASYYQAPDMDPYYRDLSKQKVQHHVFKVVPVSRLKIIAVDEFPLNPNTIILANIVDGFVISKTLFSKRLPTDLSVGLYGFVPANGDTKIQVQLTENDNTVEHIETITIPTFHKATFYIRY